MAQLSLNFLKSEFLQNVSLQMAGTGIAQVLPFLAAPLLTRLYTESDFAFYTSFFAIASILAVVVGGRYQYAIILPKDETEALRIFTLSVYITVIFSALLSVGLLIFYLVQNHSLDPKSWLIPLYILFFGIWSSLSNLSIRRKKFLNNSAAKVLQSVFYVLTAVGLGLLQPKIYGLAVGKISGTAASMIFQFRRSSVKFFSEPLRNLKDVALKYRDHPRYGIIPALLDVASMQGIVLILTKAYSTGDLGYFGLTALVFSAPVGLVAGSFKEVFYQKIAYHITHREFERAVGVFKKSALYLLLLALPISLTAYFFGEEIFKIAFGAKWARSGEFASTISVSFLFQLIVSPLSSSLYAANRLRPAFMWQSLYFMTTYLTLGTSAYVFKLPVEKLLMVYVIHEAILYTIYFTIQYSTLKKLS